MPTDLTLIVPPRIYPTPEIYPTPVGTRNRTGSLTAAKPSEQTHRPKNTHRPKPKPKLIQKPTTKPNIHQRPIQKRPIQNHTPIQNRIGILLVHIPIFSIRGQARLAEEIGVSRSTISRLAHGKINPSYRLAHAVTDALERKMGHPLDIREVFSPDGTYPTPSGCSLCQCHGCLPTFAWGTDSVLKPEWQDARPGDWSMARPFGSNTGSQTSSDTGSNKGARKETAIGEENR